MSAPEQAPADAQDPAAGVEPSLRLSASQDAVNSGGDTTLSWTASNADTCTASGGWSGDRPVSGSEVVGPLTRETTFTLSCTGPGGSVMSMLSVAVYGDVTLAWQAPQENVDGSPLTDLAGYRIYWGESSRAYTGSADVADSQTTSKTVTLESGSYYFAMTALDSEGNESAYSNEVIKTVN